MGRADLLLLVSLCLASASVAVAGGVPEEPLDIGREPQFVLDNHVIDNHWAIKYKREAVRRVFHQAERHPANPLWSGDQPSFLWVRRDPGDGLFRMWYQANQRLPDVSAKGRQFRTYVAYAQSEDGVRWERPDLDLFPGYDLKPNNVVVARPDQPKLEACSPCILEVPPRDRHGYRYLMVYRSKGAGGADTNGIRLVGSQDGIHWDADSDMRVADLHSDHHNTISYDPRAGRYVLYCRPKHIYRTFRGDMIDTGASQHMARMSSEKLWTDWLEHDRPQTILVPDEVDAQTHFNFFYGMPTRHWAGLYWGFLEPFRMNDFIYTELAVSRDGFHFEHLPGRPKMIEYGPQGTWDDEMIFASPSWVEVGDEWWIYYSGWDGPHGTPDRTGGIGLATIRKEGFVSMRGPRGGSVLCTRRIRWPGGPLLVNANAREGVLRVRVSDDLRKPIDGFDYSDVVEFREDNVSHRMQWKGRSMDELRDRTIRLEFYLQSADLYTFRAGPVPSAAP